ncbi:MAG: DMT family transporter [Proteobacteria bacterium]|nr:DMT family transporter [Pseudomonadota bacterium]
MALTMLPFLLVSNEEEILKALHYSSNFLLAGTLGATYIWVQFTSFKSLPVGIATSLRQGSRIITAIFLGVLFLGESLGGPQILLILLIIFGGTILGLAQKPMEQLEPRYKIGLLLSVGSGALIAGTFFLLGETTRDVAPLVAGYFWEAAIGLCAWGLILIRGCITGKWIILKELRKFRNILLASSPTIVGTGILSFAINMGPFAELTAITSLSAVFAALLAVWFYGEHLIKIQWLGIGICVTGVFLLQLVP